MDFLSAIASASHRDSIPGGAGAAHLESLAQIAVAHHKESLSRSVSNVPTIVEIPSYRPRRRERNSVIEQFERRLFPSPEEHAKDPYLVEFDPNDPLDPKNWSRGYRWMITLLSAILVLNASFPSSAPSGIASQLIEHFHFGSEVAVLTITIFVVGYCIGPFLWAPLSEQYGRRPIFILTFIVGTGFQAGCALSQNTATIIIMRFLAGTFAACSMTNSGAVIADIWDAGTRGTAMTVYTIAPFAGPSLGPIVGGFINTAGASWRWVFWTCTLFSGVLTVIIIGFLPETFAPVIMAKKAKALRLKTGDDNYYAPIERKDTKSMGQRIEEIVARPFQVFIEEPMLMVITLYMSFVYGCVYLLFEAYPIVFEKGHGFSTGIGGLMFLPIFIGASFGVLLYIFIFNPRYQRLVEQCKPNPVPPEARLEIAIIAAPLFAIVFFWFGWTSYPRISYWVPMLSGLGMGFSVIFIFLGFLNYIVDAYLAVAASALAANTVVRSGFGGAFPLFATQMYDALNPRWASTLVGCIALVMIPIPFVLKIYGPALRERSKNAPSMPVPMSLKPDNEDSVEKFHPV